jgi:hypothetical protein
VKNDQRRLAACAKEMSQGVLAQVATIVTLETLLAWQRHGIEPARECEWKTTWKEFISRHFAQIAPTSSDPSPAAKTEL